MSPIGDDGREFAHKPMLHGFPAGDLEYYDSGGNHRAQWAEIPELQHDFARAPKRKK